MTHEAKARPIEPSPWSSPASVLMSSNPGGGQESTGYNQVFFPMLRVAMLMGTLYAPPKQALFVPRFSDPLFSAGRSSHISTFGKAAARDSTAERNSPAAGIQHFESC